MQNISIFPKRLFHITPTRFNTVALFPGQGNISPKIFQLIQHQLTVEADEILQVLDETRPIVSDPSMFAFYDPLKSPFLKKDNEQLEKLKNTSYVQPLMLLTTYLNYKLVEKYSGWDVKRADYMIGHSLGELSALVCQDVFSIKSGMRIAQRRGELMQSITESHPGSWGMCAVIFNQKDYQIALNTIQNVLKLDIAAINGFNQVVVTGKKDHVQKKLDELVKTRKYLNRLHKWKGGLKTVWLNTDLPAHHPILKEIEPELLELVMNEWKLCGSKKLRVPIVSNVDHSIVKVDTETALRNFVKLTSKTVMFSNCLDEVYMYKEQIDPSRILDFVNVSEVTYGLVGKYFKDANINDIQNFDLIKETMSGLAEKDQ